MRNYPRDKYDKDRLKRLNAEPWMVELLKCNPEYTCWGPYEDYMCDKDGGWSAPCFHSSWQNFGPWGLDELNELVNFYFQIERPSKDCPVCGGNGYHVKAQRVVNTFYAHMNPEREQWCDKITQDEVEALVEAGRLKGPITAAEVNSQQRTVFGSHDAINRGILTKARLKRFGIPDTCEECDGHGYVFTAPEAHVNLVLWMIHPRKGCSRGVEIKNIQKGEIKSVKAFLKSAAKRNAKRFGKL